MRTVRAVLYIQVRILVSLRLYRHLPEFHKRDGVFFAPETGLTDKEVTVRLGSVRYFAHISF